MKTFIVKYINHTTGQVETNEVEAAAYVPLPQKVANFYEQKMPGDTPPRNLVATFYEVVSVTSKKQ